MNQKIEKMSMKEYKEKISSLVELHFKLMNILSFICYQTYYCFCKKYDGAEVEYNQGK